MNKTTIVIADDHPLFRSGVRAELETDGKYQVLAESGNGIEALKLINELNPDIAILDIQMPGMSGIEIAGKLRESGSMVNVVFLTMHNEKRIFFKALDLGVKGYVLKDDVVVDIVNAVDRISEGKEFISSALLGLLTEKSKSSAEDKKITGLINELTSTEKKILLLVAELRTNDEIADFLFISKRTVENHKVNISNKLLLDSSKALTRFAIRYNDLLKPD